MKPSGEEFPYLPRQSGQGAIALAPVLPLTLTRSTSLDVTGLVDSGASVNVLPYSIGLQLGGVWEDLRVAIQLGGNLAECEARGLLLSAKVGSFSPVQLGFAWVRTDDVPLLLGQMNFFLEFDVCFYRSQSVFRVKPIQKGNNSV